ncbi:lytic transglycosylase domain-containing protein, partial [Erwinia amylovora]|uniref:lytic transglycosylase domain-containing protein n=1 Tax=Erwinia amylovora TaxID=552 RepID=UPI0020C163F6
RWDATITEASQRFHVPKAWIRAVMAHESGGRTMLGQDRPIVTRAGAIGLMQVLPATYDEMATQHRLGANPFDARDNIMAGTAYLRWL